MASKCISEYNLILASKCISKLVLSLSPSASHSYTIVASKCILKLARSRPPCASLSSTWFWPPTASLGYWISASKCITKRTRSRPRSTSPSSTRSQSPSASPNSLDRGLHVRLSFHTITASKFISKSSQFASPGARAITLQYRQQPDWPYIYIERLRLIIHAILWCSESCDCNKDESDTRSALWLWPSKNHCSENMALSLPQTCAEVLAAPKFDYPNSQNSYHPKCTSITAGAFRSMWEFSCTVWKHFAKHQGGLGASGST
jgi:hypothetical protein